jgi:hypothetical protein
VIFRQKQDAYKIWVLKPQGRKSLGRLYKCEGNIKMDLREVYIGNCELN